MKIVWRTTRVSGNKLDNKIADKVGQIIPEDNADYNLLLSSLVQTMLRMRILIE